jgi:hypothetical protein
MTLRRTVLAGACAAALALSGAAAGTANAAEGGGCNWNGRVSITPGLTFSPKDFTFTVTGAIGPCTMPGGKVRTGTLSITKGQGSGGCGSAQFRTPVDVTWDDKTKSSGTATGVTSGPFGFATGSIESGEHKGAPFETVIFLNPQGPLQCGTSGVTAAELYGQITFH